MRVSGRTSSKTTEQSASPARNCSPIFKLRRSPSMRTSTVYPRIFNNLNAKSPSNSVAVTRSRSTNVRLFGSANAGTVAELTPTVNITPTAQNCRVLVETVIIVDVYAQPRLAIKRLGIHAGRPIRNAAIPNRARATPSSALFPRRYAGSHRGPRRHASADAWPNVRSPMT